MEFPRTPKISVTHGVGPALKETKPTPRVSITPLLTCLPHVVRRKRPRFQHLRSTLVPSSAFPHRNRPSSGACRASAPRRRRLALRRVPQLVSLLQLVRHVRQAHLQPRHVHAPRRRIVAHRLHPLRRLLQRRAASGLASRRGERIMSKPASVGGHLSAAQGSSTTVSRSDIRVSQHFDLSAHGLVRRWLLIGFLLIHLLPSLITTTAPHCL